MRTTPFLIALTALSLVACQNTPENTTKPTSEVPGSSSASKVSVTMLTTPAPVAGQPTTATPAPVGANAQWVAVQDGNGPWKVLEGTDGAYSFDVTNSAGKYGIAYVCPKPQPPAGSPPQPETSYLELKQFTLANASTLRFGCNLYFSSPFGTPTTTQRYKLSGKITGFEPTEEVSGQPISLSSGGFSAQPDGNYTVSLVAGKQHLMLGRRNKPAVNSTAPERFKQLILLRDLNMDADKTLDFDFATQGFNPVEKTLGFTGVQTDETVSYSSGMFLGTGTVGLNGNYYGTPGLKSVALDFIPENKLVPGDTYFAQVTGNRKLGRDSRNRVVAIGSKTWFPNITLPQEINWDVKAFAQTPYLRPQLTLRNLPNTGLLNIAFYEVIPNAAGQSTSSAGRVWQVYVSTEWLGKATSWTAPDFSGLTGWNESWGFKNIADLGWTLGTAQINKPFKWLRAIFGDPAANLDLSADEARQIYADLNFSTAGFQHPTPDKTAPIITSATPISDTFAVTVPLDAKFEINFSEEMDQASVIAAYQSDTLPASSVNFSWKAPYTNAPLLTLVITPKAPLAPNQTYSFTIGTGAKDPSGNALQAAKTYTFKTPIVP
jgi:Bacterial Ig-like domain